MVNYSLGKIYKIECNVTGLIYIGSTCEPTLARRWANHVSDYKRYLNSSKHYITSFKVLENGNYNIVLIEKYSCNSKDELLSRERYWTQQIDCVNKCKPGIFNELGKKEYIQQYRKENAQHIQETKHKYYLNNYEHFQQYRKDAHRERVNHIKHQCDCEGY